MSHNDSAAFCRSPSKLFIAVEAVFQVKVAQVDHAQAGVFQIGVQLAGAEECGNLHRAFGAVGDYDTALRLIENMMLNAVTERLFEERALVDYLQFPELVGHQCELRPGDVAVADQVCCFYHERVCHGFNM